WDVKKQVDVIKRELGWKGDQVENVPPEYNYEKIECYMQGVRDYIKYIKRGYTRPTHLASIDIRHNRLTRGDGEKIIEQYEGRRPPSLDLFLSFVGLTEDEFTEIVRSHVVSPHRYNPDVIQQGDKLADHDRWSVDGAMPREEAVRFVGDWKGRNT
ncbi:MAG: N-acetyl sugar amidotransferase, partial [Chloroflexota bacterium]|nr:N-acetyl sugar amidotransferase [Chloroflexota bacterium]